MIRVIVSDTDQGDHANTVKEAISIGYGSDISSQIEIKTGGLSADLLYADSIGAIAVVRSTTGIGSYTTLAQSYYPRIQIFMPLGSNNFEELIGSQINEIISAGAGDDENKNNTAYGNGLEFWDNDFESSVSDDISSYSNGVVAGKLLKIRDTLNCGWWEARYRARMTADRNESNRPSGTIWHEYNGYGKINIGSAVAYSGEIIPDEFINNNIMINKTLDIDIAKVNECNFSFIKGDTFRLVINVKNNGEVFILTDYTPILTAMKLDTSTTADFQLTGSDIDTSKADEGQLTFTFSPAKTENITAGNYKYDIQIKSLINTYTIIKSNIELIQDVTKESSYHIQTEIGVRLKTVDNKYLISENLIIQ
jgi:hypothetical protein